MGDSLFYVRSQVLGRLASVRSDLQDVYERATSGQGGLGETERADGPLAASAVEQGLALAVLNRTFQRMDGRIGDFAMRDRYVKETKLSASALRGNLG